MRILFVLSQRPELTGSGITLDALVREARAAGHDVFVLCGVPANDPLPSVGGLDPACVATVAFGESGDLPFDVPGMSDVMPYASTVWSTMSADALASYRAVWRARLTDAVARWRPDVVHLNHLWIVSALASDLLEGTPSVVHGHATGLRQMELCPALRDDVVAGLRGHDRFLVLHEDHARRTAVALGVPRDRVDVIGAGYRTDLFTAPPAGAAEERRGHLLYVGKYAAAKGLPWLLDACVSLWNDGADFRLHVAGDGSGAEAASLARRMRALDGRVVLHGRLDQTALAQRMQQCAALVLPSMYEGLPLVLAEARACGCSLVSTALEGVVETIAPAFGEAIELVPPPRRVGPDRPDPRDVDAFVGALTAAIEHSLARPPSAPTSGELEAFTWRAVYGRVEDAWRRAQVDD